MLKCALVLLLDARLLSAPRECIEAGINDDDNANDSMQLVDDYHSAITVPSQGHQCHQSQELQLVDDLTLPLTLTGAAAR